MSYLIASLLNVPASVLASLLGIYVYDLHKKHSQTKRFSKLKGDPYIQCNLESTPYKDKHGNVVFTQITKVDGALLTLEGNDLDGRTWNSRILMDARFPGFGFGQYHYPSSHEADWGLHVIQFEDRDADVILVQALNVSGGKDNRFPLLWVKRHVKGVTLEE